MSSIRLYLGPVFVFLIGCGGNLGTDAPVVDAGNDSSSDASGDGATDPCAGNRTVCEPGCVDLTNDAQHCGQCGTDCTHLPHSASAACVSGSCVVSACNTGHSDCNQKPGDGCEADLSSTETCGSCGLSCDATQFVCGLSGVAELACVAPTAPRPIAPASLSSSSSRRPTFRWVLPSNVSFAMLDLCSDRACTNPIVPGIEVHGTSYTPTTDLPEGIVFWRVHSLDVGAAGPIWEVRIGHLSAAISTTWGNISDVNGDGYADVVIEQYSSDPSRQGQTANLYPGSNAGLATSPTSTIYFPGGGSGSGAAAPAGDVNGDGYADMVFGDQASSGGDGYAFIAYGGASGLSPLGITIFYGAVPGGEFGSSASGVGDVNGDGYADVIVGAPEANENVGRAYLYLGSANGLVTAPAATLIPNPSHGGIAAELFGQVVAGAGDVNGDGYSDVVITAPVQDGGVVYLYLGSASGLTSPTMIASVSASAATCAGDLNGDGYEDIAIGGGTEVVVYYGGAGGIDASAPTLFDLTSTGCDAISSAGSGDVNDDGYSDVAVGCAANGTETVLLMGGLTGATLSTAPPLHAGQGTHVGDVNGDSSADVISIDISPPVYGILDIWNGSSTGFAAAPNLTMATTPPIESNNPSSFAVE